MIEEEHNAGVPILRVPTDITTEIFKHLLWVDVDSLPGQEVERRNYLPMSPLELGAVCRSWRAFVRETPSFWTVIILNIADRRCRNRFNFLSLWLQNSATLPLEIWLDPRQWFPRTYFHPDIYYQSDNSSLDYGPSIATLRKLVDQSPRWKKFNAHVIYHQEFIEVLSQVKRRIPLLQMARLQLNHDLYHTTFRMFEDAPLLRGFVINHGNIKFLHLPWRQLTSFQGLSLGGGMYYCPSQCTNLIHCKISIGNANGRAFSYYKTIFLTHLRSLNISGQESQIMTAILRCIWCPALCRLKLSGGSGFFSRELPLALEDFIDRSNCALKKLHLESSSARIPLGLPFQFLQRLPSLQSLILRTRLKCPHNIKRDPRCDVRGGFLQKCMHSETDPLFYSLLSKLELAATANSPFLANLTELRCLFPYPYTLALPLPTSFDLLKVLQQRWSPPNGVARLEKVVIEDTLILDEIKDASVIDGLRELIRRRMKIAVLERDEYYSSKPVI